MFEIFGLTVAVWVAYWGVIRLGFVSDDIEGLQHYDGKLKKFDYGHLNKWLLYKLLEKSNVRNHLFSIFLHNANVILLFLFLSTIVPVKLAFFTSILFAIHPICIQSVGWISSRGYPISLFFCLLGFNIISNTHILGSPLNSIPLALLTIGFGCLYYLSIVAQFAALATFAIQAFLGNYFLALIGLILSLVAGSGIIKEVIGVRIKTFKEQNLGRSTFFKLQKIIVAIKSLAYYTRLCIFPKRMGLYHTYEYHYSEKTEKEDKWFWWGFFILISSVLGFWYGNPIIRFGILWYYAYLFIFLNWITVHQFVSERYLYISSIGICLLIAYGLSFLDGFFFNGFPVIFALVGGLYLMRTWVHLPTYQDEVLFYQSNIWNFPDSEVAFSNLAVVYMKCNLMGSAVDMWQIAIKINPEYDVAYYNISSVMKQGGDLVRSREFLKKAVDSPKCHFKDLWTKELTQLDHELSYIKDVNEISARLNELKKTPEKQQEALNLEKQLQEINNLHKIWEEQKKKNLILIQQEEQNLQLKMVELARTKEQVLKGISPEELIKARDQNFGVLKETVKRMSETT